jgi:hypothetical protein
MSPLLWDFVVSGFLILVLLLCAWTAVWCVVGVMQELRGQ